MFAVPFSIDLPTGWRQQWLYPGGVEVGTYGSAYNPGAVSVFVPSNVFADPCRAGEGTMSPPVGPSVDDLTQALTHLPGIRTGPVTPITIDGYSGTTFDLEAPGIDVATCDGNPWLALWTYDGGPGADCGQTESGTAVKECFSGPSGGFHVRIAILDVDGTRVLINSWSFDNTTRDGVKEVNRVFDSIDFQ